MQTQEIKLSPLHDAINWLKRGYSVIPVGPDKKPYVKWEQFQKRLATKEEVREWWTKWPDARVGVVTGKLSGCCVIDIDEPKVADESLEGLIPDTLEMPVSKTPSGGQHLWFKMPSHITLGNNAKVVPGCDFRGEGGYVVTPPSPGYEWLPACNLWSTGLPDLPQAYIDRITQGAKPNGSKNPPRWQDELIGGVEDGRRNDSLKELMGRWIAKGLSKEECMKLARSFDAGCTPPLGEKVLETTYNSILNTHLRNHPNQTDKQKASEVWIDSESSLPTQDLDASDPILISTEFPKDTIQGVAKEFGDTYSQYIESPWPFLAFSFLTCLGNMVSDRVTLESQISPQPRLFTVMLGESADTRKSTAIKQAIHLFKDVFPDNFSACYGVGSAEGLVKFFQSYPKALLVYDEFKALVDKAKIEGSILSTCVTSLFENNNYSTHTKNAEVIFDRVYLSLLGASTLEIYEKMWTHQYKDIGFLNRLWLVLGEPGSRFSLPARIPLTDWNYLRDELRRIYSALQPYTEYSLTVDAKALWDEWYFSYPKTVLTKRLDTYGLRLMPLFCVNERRSIVDDDMMSRIIKLLDWQINVRRITDPIHCENQIATMEETLRRVLQRKGELTEGALKRWSKARVKGLWAYEQAMANLTKAGEICCTDGRYRALPKMLEGEA